MTTTETTARRLLPPPPPEPRAINDVNGLAPKFREKLTRVLFRLGAKGRHPILLETYRSDERADWLFKMGREWDDGRGIVTNAPNARKTWHHFQLAADIGDANHPDGAPADFYADIGEAARAEGLTWGGDWHMADKPHVQWFCEGMHVSPSDHAGELLDREGLVAVWRELHAI